MSNGIYFKNVLKTNTTHAGTKIEYAMPKAELMTKCYNFSDGVQALLDNGCSKGKIITFAENSPMKKLGIDQAYLGFHDKAKAKVISLWQDGNVVKSSVLKDSNSVNDIKNFLKVIKELAEARFKLPV